VPDHPHQHRQREVAGRADPDPGHEQIEGIWMRARVR